jgi:glyoxylase-like metal-dependent hydrolase (beta-lactamase superfamily II)
MSSLFREMERLHERVWLFPTDDKGIQPNVGIVRGDKQTVLIDAGSSPRHARMMMTEMAGLDFPPIDTVIYTHHHWESVFGAVAYNATSVIAHETASHALRQMASRTWSAQSLREESQRLPHLEARNANIQQAVGDWRDFRVVSPSLYMTQRLQIHLAPDFTLDILHAGGQHADDCLIVRLPSAGIVFLGDCLYPAPYDSGRSAPHDRPSLNLLERIYAFGDATLIDARTKPRTRAEFAELLAYERARHDAP